MKNTKTFDISDWIPITDISDQITLKSGIKLKMLEVKPINFSLKSDAEQISILESYKRFLKQCNFEMQIIVQACKSDVESHVQNVQKYSFGNTKLEAISKNYINLINSIIENKKSIVRRFFIILKVDKNISENIERIISGLSNCGNEVTVCDSNQIKAVFKNYFCKE